MFTRQQLIITRTGKREERPKMNLLESINEHVEVDVPSYPRTECGYTEFLAEKKVDIEFQLSKKLFTREAFKSLDTALRRVHEFYIEQNETFRGNHRRGAFYTQVGLEAGDIVKFEHMTVNKNTVQLLIAGRLTIEQAFHMPIAIISEENDVKLSENGLANTTPDIFLFWKRYACIDAEFVDWNGNPVNKNMTLDDHFKSVGGL